MTRFIAILWLAAWALFSVPWRSATWTPQWQNVEITGTWTSDRTRVSSTNDSRPHFRGDRVRNVLFYVPVAPLGAGAGLPLSWAIAAGPALSLTAEGLQLFSTRRTPSVHDVIANVAGTLAGAALVAARRRRRHGKMDPSPWSGEPRRADPGSGS